ncbi:ABC transporter substrate-binding protein [Kribbella antibiotica]|uniref:Probable sugar-binding periplasmic protein n=1 Tax=Kribbella antibiotica TaxID=190195 RepID=A0A4R4ZQP6_9ACTN|nr:ABC transporter substrate-binding protein [Kribbella antibiotica]TDD61288.1 ABC transporter substrate-binding protein [Kribbella antibiotica]
MKSLAAVAAALLVCAGCVPSVGGQEPGDPQVITLWHPLKDPNEVKAVRAALDRFEAAHPGITVKAVPAQDADKVTQAIRGGKPPDAALSFNASSVGAWCATGAFQDLGPWIQRDKVDLQQIPAAVRSYTEFEGKRCVMPLLADTYALYYNKKLLAAAGYSKPPKTISELTAMTKRLTKFSADGTIEVAGFVPYLGTYHSGADLFAAAFGATWLQPDGSANFADDPAFQEMLQWQKSLVDWFGVEKLALFKAGLADEFSSQHAFNTGKIAMMLDGEWRTSFLTNDEAPVDYGTAAVPVADNKPGLYGAGLIGGNIIGVPRGAANPEGGWELVRFLSTDTEALVHFADAMHNVPTTLPALNSPRLDLSREPEFAPFLAAFRHPRSTSQPATSDGGAYLAQFGQFADKWQQGKVPDLAAGLRTLDRQNDDALRLGS